MRRFWRMTVMCLVVGLGLGYAFSCSSPTKPKEPKGLRLYVNEGWTNNIYVFDPETKTLSDSMYSDYAIGIILSPDGEYLFTTHDAPPAPGRQVLKKIRTKDFEIVGEMDGIGAMNWLEGGEILLRRRSRVIDYIDPVSLNVERSDSIAFRELAAADTLGFVIGTGVGSDWRLIMYNFRNKQIIAADSIYIPNGALAYGLNLAMSRNGDRGFGIFRDSYQGSWFLEFTIPGFDVQTAFQLAYPYGEIAISPDNRYVLFSDPGDPWHGSALHKFAVYDAAQQQIIHVIDTDTLTLLQYFPDALIASITFSPHGSIAFMSCGNNGATGPILYFDMKKFEFTDELHVDFGWCPGTITVGYKP